MHFTSRFSLGISALALLLTVSSSAQADTLFSSLPSGNSGVGVTGPTSSPGFYTEVAGKFSPFETATLTSILVPFYHNSGNNDALTFTLYDNVSNLPGASLATFTLPAGSLAGFSSPNPLYSLNFGSILLTAGTSYWLGAATTTTTYDVWLQNGTGLTVPTGIRNFPNSAFSLNGNVNVAFQVNGTPTAAATPEPGTLTLLLGASLAMLGWRSVRRSAL